MPIEYCREGRIHRRGRSHFGEVLVVKEFVKELEVRGDQITQILCNAVVPDGQNSREIDLIVVGPFGATAIEVKFFKDPVKFDGQRRTLRCPINAPEKICLPEPRDQARQSMTCLNSLLRDFSNKYKEESIAVNGMLLFANENQVIRGDAGSVIPHALKVPGVRDIVRGEFARTHRSMNYNNQLSKDQIERICSHILGANVNQPTQTIDQYELLQELRSEDLLEFEAKCVLPSAPPGESYRLRRHELGWLNDRESERVWRLVWREYQALRALAKQQVRGIPLPHDPFLDPDNDTVAWTVSDYIPGNALHQRMKERPLPIGPVLAEVAEILHKAHAAGVIHRHFTTESLWISEKDDSPWILDWDMARLCEQQTIASQLTGRFQKISRYIAPEVRDRPDRVNASSDLYSFAIVTLECLSGSFLPSDQPAAALAVIATLPRNHDGLALSGKLLGAAVSEDPTQRGDLIRLGSALRGVPMLSRQLSA